jgi:hypothetical protein
MLADSSSAVPLSTVSAVPESPALPSELELSPHAVARVRHDKNAKDLMTLDDMLTVEQVVGAKSSARKRATALMEASATKWMT